MSLISVNQYIMLMPKILFSLKDKYLNGLFVLANNPDSEVRKLVCSAFVQLIDVRPDFLKPYLRNVIEYMLIVNKDSDDEIALQACEFWSAYCDAELPPGNLKEFLPRLIQVLLSIMVYADDDESLHEEDDDGSIPDREQDLKPRFHASRFHGDDDGNDDDDDTVNVWNLRKCSAAALDTLSNVFGDEILAPLIPIIETNLSKEDDAAWKEKEAAVLAIGAIAEGCINGLNPNLSKMVSFLIPLLDNKFPLIRSISSWTLPRFSNFIVSQGREGFSNVVAGLLRRMLDDNKRVQEAACSAFPTLEEEAGEELLAHFLDVILQQLMCAFGKYQRRNLRLVYDSIATLVNAVGAELNQPKYLHILMPPLISKWQQISDSDKEIFPLLECFTSIAQALGTGFSQFAQLVFLRTQQLAKTDKEFVVCCLDLLSGLAEGFGSGIAGLVSQSNLRDLLLQCCIDNSFDVRQSAFALLGDLAQSCPTHLHPHLPDFLDAAAKQLNPASLKENVAVADNACWAIGESAAKVQKDVLSPVVMNVVSCLVPVLQHAGDNGLINRSLIQNSMITLGRLALACPELVSQHLKHFLKNWCVALSVIRDCAEKEDAFRGLCAVVKRNPSSGLNSLAYLCRAIASLHAIRSEDLYKDVFQVLHGYKHMLSGGGAWEQFMSTLEHPVKEKLSIYGV